VSPLDPAPPTLAEHLRTARLEAPVAALLERIAVAGRAIAREVARAALHGRLGETGAVNVQGERVKQLDAWANQALVEVFGAAGPACGLVSEELADTVALPGRCGPGALLVCFDPLDGSLNADVNGAVGTIVGARRCPGATGDHRAAVLAPGTTQVAAAYLLYGPATVLVYTVGHGVHGFTLDTDTGEFRLTHPGLRMPGHGRTYSVNDANWERWGPAPRAFLTALRAEAARGRPYAQRYGGALVADFHRILLEGGIYLYPAEPGGARAAGRLRLLYEGAPLALIAEAAGGRASTGTGRVLDVRAGEPHQRVPLLIGSAAEVDRAVALHDGPG
jgi:fructose-1,6-bisphosphatase I